MNVIAVNWLIVMGLLLVALVIWVLRIVHKKQRVGQLDLPNGHNYVYLMGDYMRSYGMGGAFHGIDVVLPKELPHIYLNSLRAGGRRMRYIIDPSQQVQLEGNFSRDFQVFVPKKYTTLALSLLSPDVMATLQDCATAFDVEIYGSHVRVISNKRVLPRAQLQVLVLRVATKVMQEVDHRLQSWSQADSLDAANQELMMSPSPGFRILGRHLNFMAALWVMYWLIVTGGLGILGAYLFFATDLRLIGVLCMTGFVGGLVSLLLVTRRDLRRMRFGSRH